MSEDHRHEDHLGEFTEELRLLAETMLERVEPVLRRAAAEDRAEWSGCGWCPICAAVAMLRGEHHDVLSAVAEHGTAIVTVLREALSGMPVDPVYPQTPDPGEGVSRETPGGAGPTARGGAESPGSRPGASGYESIPVQIKG